MLSTLSAVFRGDCNFNLRRRAAGLTIVKRAVRNVGEIAMPLQETELSKALLEIEACIISENDTYAVVAVRLDKAVIARNLPFLAAVADLRCTCTDKCPASG